MEKSRRRLKSAAVITLMYAIGAFVDLAAQILLDDFSDAKIPEGAPSNIVLIAQIVLIAIAFVFSIPSFYVGIKGIKVANNPDDSKAHIVWAVILLILSFIGLAGVVLGFLADGNLGIFIGNFVLVMINIIIYIDFIKCAKRVADEY